MVKFYTKIDICKDCGSEYEKYYQIGKEVSVSLIDNYFAVIGECPICGLFQSLEICFDPVIQDQKVVQVEKVKDLTRQITYFKGKRIVEYY